MIEKIKELHISGLTSSTEISKILFPDLNPRVGRKRIDRALRKHGITTMKSNKATSEIIHKDIEKSKEIEKFVLSAWDQSSGKMMDIDSYCSKYNLPRLDIKDYKLITHTGTPYYNIHFKDNVIDSGLIDIDFIDELVSKHIKGSKKLFKVKKKKHGSPVIRAIYSDTHVGMCPNPDGKSMYGGKWDSEELFNRLLLFVDSIINKSIINESSELIIDDLGDFMDGWDGYTVRRDHEIPQNMTSTEAFDLGVEFKVMMVDMLVDTGLFSSITLNNVCNDNHSGSFGYVVNSAVRSILESKYNKLVSVNNIQKFISHYIVGDHCFILCHGKDEKHMKFGFKTNPDDKTSSKIDQYIKSNDLYQKAKYFEFSKGDSHQMIFDFASSDDFKYMNYPAFSPSSDWVQTNFKRGKSGFVIQTINYNTEEIDFYYKFFKWVK